MGVVDADGACQRWSFPPVLDQFDLMDTETDPTELEAIFTDERYGQFWPPLYRLISSLHTHTCITYTHTYIQGCIQDFGSGSEILRGGLSANSPRSFSNFEN